MAARACAPPDPTLHQVMDIAADGAAIESSTGAADAPAADDVDSDSDATWLGDPSVAPHDSVRVRASMPPLNPFGDVLASPNPGSAPTPTSVGVLCLGGPFARFAASVLRTPDSGTSVGTGIDLRHIPVNPPTSVVAGQTWHFQYWFRDSVGMSNFSDGLRITFQ